MKDAVEVGDGMARPGRVMCSFPYSVVGVTQAPVALSGLVVSVVCVDESTPIPARRRDPPASRGGGTRWLKVPHGGTDRAEGVPVLPGVNAGFLDRATIALPTEPVSALSIT